MQGEENTAQPLRTFTKYYDYNMREGEKCEDVSQHEGKENMFVLSFI